MVVCAFAQTSFDSKFSQLMFDSSMPKKLLESKTMVLVDLPNFSQKEYERVSSAFHQEITKSGIDAVVYYPFEVIFSGVEVTRSFMLDFEKREIENLILLQYKGDNSKVAVLSLDLAFLIGDKPKMAWLMEGVFKEISHQLYLNSANSGLERKNFLVNEQPEQGLLTNPFIGRRSDFFSLNLKESKLAVPLTGDNSKDAAIKRVFETIYKYPYKFVANDIPDSELQKEGFQFVFRFAGGPIEVTRKLLGYDVQPSVSVYMSVLQGNKSEVKPIRKGQPAYKAYVKQLSNDNVFLGTEWDAGSTLLEGITNHLNSINKGLN